MPARPIVSEFMNESRSRDTDVLERRISELEDRIARLESALTVSTSGDVSLQANQLNITSVNIQVESPTTRFIGVVQTDTITANTVVGASYTPGAGNIH